jgi:hypothetical protein
MTVFGKLLVFVNLFIGVGLLSWSLSAYGNRADWLDGKDAEGKATKGQISRLNEEITTLTKGIADAQAGYAARSSALANLEANRDYRRGQFKVRLDAARAGTDPFGKQGGPVAPFREQLAYKPGVGDPTFTDLAAVGNPILGPDGQPLRGLEALTNDFAAQAREAQRLVEGQAITEEEWAKLAQGLSAEEFEAVAAKMGLTSLRRAHGILSDRVAAVTLAAQKQKEIRGNLGEEKTFLADRRIDWEVRLQALQRRERQLREELRKLGG